MAGETSINPSFKVLPADLGMYTGAFVSDNVSKEAIQDFEKMSGAKLALVVKFLAFTTGLNFPMGEAKLVEPLLKDDRTPNTQERALFIKLEPNVSLKDIVAGRYDAKLKNFARGAAQYGRAVVISFGHEMNGFWYDWGKDPELYLQAYKRVYDILSQEYNLGTKSKQVMARANFTWVWTPNIDYGKVRDYYPGDEYVDWVGIDGYNSTDAKAPWRSCSDLFSTILDEVALYHKPIMIAEFGSDENPGTDEPALKAKFVGQCIDYFVEDRRVKGYVYFNIDKPEEGAMKNWSISGAAKQAWHDAHQRNEAFLRQQIDIGSDIPVFAATPPKFPRWFERELFKCFLVKNRRDMAKQATLGRKSGAVVDAEDMKKLGMSGVDLADTWRDLNETKILIWLAGRNLGEVDPASLKDKVNLKEISAFWKALLGIIVLNDDPIADEFLKDMGIKTPYLSRFNAKEKIPDKEKQKIDENRLAILEEIYTRYISKLEDPKLQVENITKRALLLWDLGQPTKAKVLMAEAEKRIAYILAPANEEKVKIAIWARYWTISNVKKDLNDKEESALNADYWTTQAKVRLFLAQIILARIENEKDRTKLIAELGKAYRLAQEASDGSKAIPVGLQDFELLEVYLVAAEALIRLGFVLKGLEPAAATTALAGLQKSYPEFEDYKHYKQLLNAGRTLLNEVLSWENQYNAIVTDEKRRHPWLKQLADQARIKLQKVGPDNSDLKGELWEQ